MVQEFWRSVYIKFNERSQSTNKYQFKDSYIFEVMRGATYNLNLILNEQGHVFTTLETEDNVVHVIGLLSGHWTEG